MGGRDGSSWGGRDADGRQGGGGNGDGDADQSQTSTAHKAVVVVSVTFTVLLFAYAGWQMAAPPAQTNAPQVSVVDTAPIEDGNVAVTVRLRNPTDVGLVTVTVESNCSSPPAEVQFSYVPASSTRTGTLVCPSGTTSPTVSVANWISR